ncbi:hypothetical protein GCM10007160_13900 [Litchfieldella qijiaojingensis]|uniref:Permease n=1 Tax=Litchfieldella qijiaojingensis TaxID=980347 RepID=A0ABQ2YLH2_9GAMM|nr:permease [Halomonas qijiaojingensis]GGX87745.1 hypothetical protein GCM10007160_13900 [Halomonas qijiaojingensis]
MKSSINEVSRVWWLAALTLLAGSWLEGSIGFLLAVFGDLLALIPLVVLAAALAGWLGASTGAEGLSRWLRQRPGTAIVTASVIGAITPVCGIAMVPLVAALLRHGVPISAAMAFWLSSPITDPGMFILTLGFLGWPFAAGMVLAAFGLGLLSGIITHRLRLEDALNIVSVCGTERHRVHAWQESLTTFWLIVRWLLLALGLEALMRDYLPESSVVQLLGSDSLGSVPLAVLIGTPLYLEGYAALPLVRGLIELGMSQGAAMALLIAGGAISLYTAVAVWSLVSRRLFALYMGFAVGGAMLVGWLTDLVVHLLA